jgi:hypothetical protein
LATIFLGLSALLNCQILVTVIGIRLSPKAINGEMKNVIIVIAVVGRPIPITPFTTPARKNAIATMMEISLPLFKISKT